GGVATRNAHSSHFGVGKNFSANPSQGFTENLGTGRLGQLASGKRFGCGGNPGIVSSFAGVDDDAASRPQYFQSGICGQLDDIPGILPGSQGGGVESHFAKSSLKCPFELTLGNRGATAGDYENLFCFCNFR